MENCKNSSKFHQYSKKEIRSILKAIILSLLGIIIFFVPIKINNQLDTAIFHISYYLENKLSFLIEIYLIVFVSLISIKNIIEKEKSTFYKLNIMIRIFSIVMLVSFMYEKVDLFIIDDKFIFVLRDIITNIVILLPVCAFFLPLLLEYGLIELVEAYTHKFMKKCFNVSGKVVLNILIYLFVDNLCGLFVTYKLYKDGKLKQKEACITILNFSVLSISLTSDLCSKINLKTINFIILEVFILIICNFIICRIYPLNKKKQSYFVKSGYKDVNCKKNKVKVAIKKYNNHNKNKKLLYYCKSYFNETIYIFMNLVPNIIFIFFLGSILFNIPIVEENINNVFYSVDKLLKLGNGIEIAQISGLSFFHNILGIKSILESTPYFTKIIIGLIITLQCINISILIPFIVASIIPLNIREVILVYIERYIIIITLSSLINFIYMNYIM